MDPEKYSWVKELAPSGYLDHNEIVKNLMGRNLKYKNEVIQNLEQMIRDLSAKNDELFD